MGAGVCANREKDGGMKVLHDIKGAKYKWCPMAANDGLGERCLADGCMAWRWANTNISDGSGGLKESDDTHGFCGMASDPTQ